jgi:hypothetical protein
MDTQTDTLLVIFLIVGECNCLLSCNNLFYVYLRSGSCVWHSGFRKACHDAKVHRAPMKGIVGTVKEGAFSIVVNEGYEDDIDEGDVMCVLSDFFIWDPWAHSTCRWYTGAGGQDNRYGGVGVYLFELDMTHTDLGLFISRNRSKLIRISNMCPTVRFMSVLTLIDPFHVLILLLATEQHTNKTSRTRNPRKQGFEVGAYQRVSPPRHAPY